MAASDASIYWNLKHLSRKLLGKGISTSAGQESGTEELEELQRRLLTAAYAVLLDNGPQVAVRSALKLWPEVCRACRMYTCCTPCACVTVVLLLHITHVVDLPKSCRLLAQ